MEITYIREDIYYCKGCGHFFDIKSNELVNILYSEMPASFALKVMNDRQRPFRPCHARRRAKSKKTPRGFS